MSGETTEVGAGIERTLCNACGAVAAIDLRGVENHTVDEIDLPSRRSLWQ